MQRGKSGISVYTAFTNEVPPVHCRGRVAHLQGIVQFDLQCSGDTTRVQTIPPQFLQFDLLKINGPGRVSQGDKLSVLARWVVAASQTTLATAAACGCFVTTIDKEFVGGFITHLAFEIHRSGFGPHVAGTHHVATQRNK